MLPSTGQHTCLLPTPQPVHSFRACSGSLCACGDAILIQRAPLPDPFHSIYHPASASAAIHCTFFLYAAAPCALACGLSKPAGSPAACFPAGCLCRPLCSHTGCLCVVHPRLPTSCLANNRQPACTCHAPHLLTFPHTSTPPSRFDSAPLIARTGLLLISLLAPALYHPQPCPVPTIFPMPRFDAIPRPLSVTPPPCPLVRLGQQIYTKQSQGADAWQRSVTAVYKADGEGHHRRDRAIADKLALAVGCEGGDEGL